MKRIISFMLVAILMFTLAPLAIGASVESSDNGELKKARDAAEMVLNKRTIQNATITVEIEKPLVLNQAPELFQAIEGREYDELSQEEKEKMLEIVVASQEYYNNIISSVSSDTDTDVITPMYFESQLSKAIEAAIYVGFPTLSVSDIAKSFQNANTARDIGVTYANLMGYTQTWDNPADAYRHFAWNWLNTKDIGANDARVFGDYHELAMAAAVDANNQTALSFDQKVTYGVARAFVIRSNTQGSLSAFNSQFAADSVMDIYNNSQGRRYALYNSNPNVGDAFYQAFATDNALIGWTSNVNSSVRSTAFGYWQ
ncbi:DUF6973 domain-containing protein [Paenibacillus sp. TC-CSREp1]|uniref:DUF6973 domain-containing protein n=1 Tax=Paenibacillus sp. TC-CSREp1 TaxID=3410089 RepID=UPI003D05F67F